MKILIKYFPLILCAVIGNNEFTHWLKIIKDVSLKIITPNTAIFHVDFWR